MSRMRTFAPDALAGRKALVWGASAGIGLACARQMAAMGAQVVLLARSADKLAAAAQAIRAEFGVPAGFEVVDLNDESALAAALARHEDTDILITNSGGPLIAPFVETPLAEWDAAWRQIVRAVVQATQFLVPRMAERGFGRIIMIASRSVATPLPNMAISNALRKALLGIAETIAGEYARFGVSANLLCPGLTRTERMQQNLKVRARRAGLPEEQVLQQMLAPIAAARAAEPEEIAAAAGFLASEAAGYMQAQYLVIDGGKRL